MLCRANFSTQRPHGRAAISAALRMLCRANSSTHRPPGRTLHKKRMPHSACNILFPIFLFQCPHGRTAIPAAARMLCRADFSAQSPSARLRCRGFPFWPRGPLGRTAISAAVRMLCRADFNAQSPSARLRCRGFPFWPRGPARADSHTCCRPNTLPRRFQRPVPTSTAALPGLPVLAVRPRGRARFCLFAVARRCAGCLSWCAAPAFCSRRPCCRSAGQRALLQSGCRSGTACRAAPSCRQRTAG